MGLRLVATAAAICLAVIYGPAALGQVTPDGKVFWHFESGQVRPLALSPDGTRLFAVNTPDNHLEIFDVTPVGLTHVASVPVGLEPVAVAARTDTEVWVVNHLSDSISIVDVSSTPAHVVRTIEPDPRFVEAAAKGTVFGPAGAARSGSGAKRLAGSGLIDIEDL